MAFASGKKWGLEHAVFAGATAATIFGAVTGRERVQQVAKPLIAPALATRVLRGATTWTPPTPRCSWRAWPPPPSVTCS